MANSVRWTTLLERAAAAGVDVSNVDVRNAGKLRASHPEIFPRELRACQLAADINGRGEWVVFRRQHDPLR